MAGRITQIELGRESVTVQLNRPVARVQSSPSNCICLLGFVIVVRFGRVIYPGTALEWSLFWDYALWGLSQGSIGVFGFPVELRSTGASTTFTAGRLVGTR